MRRALAKTGLAVALVALLAACGGSDEATTPTAEDASPTTTEAVDTTRSPDDEYPCTLLTQAEVDEIAGNPLDPGDMTTNNVDENGTKWVAEECTWPASELGGTELALAVSKAEDFPAGTIDCPVPANGTPVTGIGDEAYWTWTEATETGVGELRVCTDEVMLGARVSGPGGESAIQPKAEALAQAALAAI